MQATIDKIWLALVCDACNVMTVSCRRFHNVN